MTKLSPSALDDIMKSHELGAKKLFDTEHLEQSEFLTHVC